MRTRPVRRLPDFDAMGSWAASWALLVGFWVAVAGAPAKAVVLWQAGDADDMPSAQARERPGSVITQRPTDAFAAMDGEPVGSRFDFRDWPPEDSGILFVHRSGARGVDKRFMIECVGAGVGLIDVEDDGDLDLYLVQGGSVGSSGEPVGGAAARDALYVNEGRAWFVEAGDGAGELSDGFGFGVTAADVDDDGDEDIFVTNLGPNDLLTNDGRGHFERAEAGAGLAGAPDDWSIAAAFGDADLDGDLDVYVTNYLAHDLDHPMLAGRPCKWLGCEVPCGPLGLAAQADRFYVNDGAGHFEEATERAGFAAARPAYAFQPVFSDLDGDGDLDLFVANDSVANGFYVNEGVGADGFPRFAEHGLRSGLALSSTGKDQAGMGVAVGDADGDLKLDIVMTNFSREQNALFRNASDPAFGALFFDEGGRMGIGRPSYFDLGWGASFFDADLDGRVELFIANGHIYPQVDRCGISSVRFAQRDQLFTQLEPGRWEPATDRAGSGFDQLRPGRGSAVGDLDGDGDLDIVVNNLDQRPSVLLNHSVRRGLALVVDLRPLVDAVGARVVVDIGGRQWIREVARGSSFASTEDRRLHFGLPGELDDEAITARVHWPGGDVETFTELVAGSANVLERGRGR